VIKFAPWSRPEKFLILEALPERTRGLLLSVDAEKNLQVRRFWEEFPVAKLSRRVPWEFGGTKIILAADPSLAFTVFVPVKLEREPAAAKEQLGILELENLLAQSIGKVFSQCRKQAGQALRVGELETVLVGSRVRNFKVDGHKVVNPLGFQGKKIEAVLELTLTTRKIFESWKSFFSTREKFFFTESARAWLTSLEKAGAATVNLITFRPETTSFFILEPAATGTVIYRGKLDWETNRLLESITSSLGVSRSLAEELYGRYLRGETSSSGARWIDRILKPVLDSLFHAMKKTRLRGPIYVDTMTPLPIALPKRRGKIVLTALPLASLVEKLGFTLQPSRHNLSDTQLFRHLAPFLEFYYDKSDSSINHKLWRRLHWLGPPEARQM